MLVNTQLVGFGGVSGIGGNDGFTELLIHFDGSDGSTTFTDVSSNAFTVTTVGNAQVDTAQSVFGGASMLCDGTGDGATVADNANLRPGTGDFTIDCWVRFAADSGDRSIYGKGSTFAEAGSYLLYYEGSLQRVVFSIAGTIVLQDTSAISVGTWYHFAVSRSGTSIKLFRDGVEVDSDTNSTNLNDTNSSKIGASVAGDMNGWIDELRVSIGIARWTANFTPPTGPYE